MLLLNRFCKPIGIVVGLTLLGACGDTDSAGNERAAAGQSEDATPASASAQTVLVADIPHVCDVLTQDLAASVLKRAAEEIQAMDRPGSGVNESCTWYFASNPAVGMEQQLTLFLGTPPLRYVNSQRDDPEKMGTWLKAAVSIRNAELEYLGEMAGGRLFAADLGSRSKLLLATGLRAVESQGADPIGEVLINATLQEDLAHEERVNRLKSVVEAAAIAL